MRIKEILNHITSKKNKDVVEPIGTHNNMINESHNLEIMRKACTGGYGYHIDTSFNDTFKSLKLLIKSMNEIYESDISWEAKHDLIYSKDISYKIISILKFEHNYPNTTPEENVTYFVENVNNYFYCNKTENEDI